MERVNNGKWKLTNPTGHDVDFYLLNPVPPARSPLSGLVTLKRLTTRASSTVSVVAHQTR